MNKGYIYCVSNPCMPGILKIGITKNTPNKLLDEANTYNIWKPPLPYVIIIAKKVNNIIQKKSALYYLLEKYTSRVISNSCYFNITTQEIKSFFDLIDGEVWIDNNNSKLDINNNNFIDTNIKDSDINMNINDSNIDTKVNNNNFIKTKNNDIDMSIDINIDMNNDVTTDNDNIISESGESDEGNENDESDESDVSDESDESDESEDELNEKNNCGDGENINWLDSNKNEYVSHW